MQYVYNQSGKVMYQSLAATMETKYENQVFKK